MSLAAIVQVRLIICVQGSLMTPFVFLLSLGQASLSCSGEQKGVWLLLKGEQRPAAEAMSEE